MLIIPPLAAPQANAYYHLHAFEIIPKAARVTHSGEQKATSYLLRDPACFIALGFGAGLSPMWPGTVGALVALPLFALMSMLTLALSIGLLLLFLIVGIFACTHACAVLGKQDHGQIVWDETVGMLIVLFTVPQEWPWWLAAFIAFRFFDIAKPWPVRLADVYTGDGLAVMLDDVLAAAYASALILLIRVFTG